MLREGQGEFFPLGLDGLGLEVIKTTWVQTSVRIALRPKIFRTYRKMETPAAAAQFFTDPYGIKTKSGRAASITWKNLPAKSTYLIIYLM